MAAKGRPTPLDNEPDLYPDLRDVWDAFWTLSPSRSSGMAMGPIPFESVAKYAELYRVEEFEEFHALVRAMDSEFLKHVNKAKDG